MTRSCRLLKFVFALCFTVLAAGGGAICVHAAQARKVTEVRYIGLKNITPRDLEGLLPFVPGDAWREDLVRNTKQAVTGYYAKRGFYQAKVNVYPAIGSSEDRFTLVIRVDEGEPCRVKSLWVDDPPGFKSKHVMLRFKSDMADYVKMAVGDRYDEQVLTDQIRALREWLVTKNFILANTDKVRLTYNDDRTEVAVVLAVDYGERVTFGFQGANVFTQGELNEFIAQVRATGLGKDYVGVIQRKFEDEYRSRAYNDLRIETKYGERPNSKHVTFIFSEGVRTELDEVSWEGLSESNSALARNIFQKESARLVQRGFFVEKDVDKAILVIIEDLKSRGYLLSKLIAKSVLNVKSPPKTKRVRVSVQIAEGEQTLVDQLQLEGFRHIDQKRLNQILSTVEGSPFNPFALEEGLHKLRAFYIGEGYLEFHFPLGEEEVVTFSENNRSAKVRIKVEEGPRIKIGNIQVKGLQKTKEFVVQREITVGSDDWWLQSALQETESNIRNLGLFSEVKMVPLQSAKGSQYRDLSIEVKEAEPGALEAGPGYRSDLGARAFARLSYNNLFGRNWIGSLGAGANRRLTDQYRFIEYNFDATFIEPRFFDTRLIYSLGINTRKQRFPADFNAVTTQIFTSFEHKIFKILSAKIAYRYERIRQFDVYYQGRLLPDDNRSILIGSIVPSITLDTRDSPFTATGGLLVTASLEYAHPNFSGQDLVDSGAPGYQKWLASIHKYTLLPKDIVWSNVVATGFARSNIAGREIPLIKLFRLGGYSTIRGFAEDSLNVDATRVLGTLSYLNLRTQFDIPLVGELKFAPFLDAGNLFIDVFRNSPFFRVGAGVGLHYMTPIGPINLDWGHKLNPQNNESPNQLHFSVGLI